MGNLQSKLANFDPPKKENGANLKNRGSKDLKVVPSLLHHQLLH